MSESTALPARGGGLFRLIRESLAGGEHDLTTETIGRAVILLAVPMVIEMLMESVFAVVDIYFVGRLGVEAVAAVGMTEAMVSIIYAVAVGLSMATTAMVSRRIGEKDRDGAAGATVQAIALGLVVSTLIAVPTAVLAPRLLEIMGGSPELVAGGSGYTRVLLAGNLTIVLLFIINAVFRGAGDAAVAMKVLWLANGVNLVLDPCLIFGWGPFPELGLTGAAVATTIGRGLGVAFQLLLLFRGKTRIRLHAASLRLQSEVMKRLLRTSMGGVGQYLVSTASWVLLMRLVSTFGDAAVAGYTLAIRVILFALMPSWGVANAAATLVGQNLGAGRPDRAEASVWRVAWYNAGLMMVVAVVFVFWARPLLGIFTSDPVVLGHGTACLRIIAYGYGVYAIGMVMAQSFNGAGDTVTPTRLNLLCYWCFQFPLAWVLSRGTTMEVTGVFTAIPIAELVYTVVAVMVFRRGAWKDREI